MAYKIASLRFFPALNFGSFVALSLIGFPVLGFLPSLSGRSVTLKDP
jgi:hypothetical protein